MSARRFLITGRVQGVGYRWFVVHTAAGLGIRGHARNLSDGSVEVIAAGPADALARLAEALAAGPRGARVAAVEGHEIPDETTVPKGFNAC